jgi:NitT/TauT family transport system substrate-binding protein
MRRLCARFAVIAFTAGRGLALTLAILAPGFLAGSDAMAADRIRLVAQRTGSLAWELDVIKTHGLDRKANLDIDTLELASTEAGKIALKGGSADVIVSDWTWVARERALGDGLVYYPYLSTLGAVMAPARSPIRDIADLKGKKLAVAGGPIDKSWLLLRALGLRSGLDLKTQATIVFGAPPLLSEKALQGETDATLTFWNFCADLEAKGQKRAITMDDVLHRLGATGPVALLGYAFDGAWAARNRSALDRFLAASRQAKDILAPHRGERSRRPRGAAPAL